MKFWQSITWAETDQLVPIARFAEELGFEGIIGADHALYPERMAPAYPYSESGNPPQTAKSEYPDMWTSCAAMAAVTERLRFVCGIYVLPLRNPIEVAKQAATLSILSEGRFVLGAGTGWMKEEFDLYGVDFATRRVSHGRDDRGPARALARRVLRLSRRALRLRSDRREPRTAPPDSTLFRRRGPGRSSAHGPGGRTAGSGPGNTLENAPVVLAELARLRSEAGRAEEPLDTLVGLYGEVGLDDYRRLGDLGMTAGIHLPFWFAFDGPSTLDQKKRLMERFAEDVLRHFA